MEKFELAAIGDFDRLISNLQYGSVLVKIESEDCFDLLTGYINLCKHMFSGLDIIELKPSKEEYGYHQLIWKSRHDAAPMLTGVEMNLERAVVRAAADFEIVTAEVRPELHRYAKKLAKDAGIKFAAIGNEVAFNGRKRDRSAYKQIEEAFRSGVEYIEFDVDKVGPQTVRVYASQLNNFSGKKIKVSVAGGKIRVTFKERPEAIHEDKFRVVFSKMVEDMGVVKAMGVVCLVTDLKNPFEDEAVEETAEEIYVRDTGFEIGGYDSVHVRQVDGLHQTYMAELEAEAGLIPARNQSAPDWQDM